MGSRIVLQNLTTFKINNQLKSINTWGYVFYSSVLENSDLILYLKTGKLPNYI